MKPEAFQKIRQVANPSERDDAPIVSAVINMGRSLLQRVIAEGVETREQLAFLQTRGCDEGQGYYFSRPVVPQQFANLLETGIIRKVLTLKADYSSIKSA